VLYATNVIRNQAGTWDYFPKKSNRNSGKSVIRACTVVCNGNSGDGPNTLVRIVL